MAKTHKEKEDLARDRYNEILKDMRSKHDGHCAYFTLTQNDMAVVLAFATPLTVR